MRIELIKTYKSVHTWTGIIAGLFLYIAFVAGALTMFKGPLNQWALQAETSLPNIHVEEYDQLIHEVLRLHPEAAKRMTVQLPPAGLQAAPVSWEVEDHETHRSTFWYASFDEKGVLITQSFTVSAIGEFVDDLHRTAGIPGGDDHDAFGTYVLGVVAALYFVALISGLIVFLPTWFKDLLVVRKGKNRKRYWLDFHNVLGVSSLPFHLIIAFTAFVFAFHDPLYDVLRTVVYGDLPMFTRPAPQEVKNFSDLVAVADLEKAIKQSEPEFQMAEVLYMNLDTTSPRMRVGGFMLGHVVRGAEYAYVLGNPYLREIPYSSILPNYFNGYSGMVMSLFSLHFGSFGGNAVRWIYFALGIMGALIFFTGNLLWIESRRKKRRAQGALPEQTISSMIMAKLTIGVGLGTVLGIAASMLAVKWLSHSQVDITLWQEGAYYVGFLTSVVWAFICRPMTTARQLLMLCSAAVFLIPASSLFKGDLSDATVAVWAVDLCALLLSLVFIFILFRLRKRQVHIEPDSVWAEALVKSAMDAKHPNTISSRHPQVSG
ncbi:PepSY domain-containing protein [Microbulbifer sp. OS29]|uniref:PepSY domain-containing protein n=1 Tax=Microbulbifer okhotskensis TaxID=2926617 RepID=A0A9X2EQ59_9GAMM|nr:PepSY-associated TM helix domain-containing protein [Microbulbifer okhotskensis]MCO1336367.1 PepSY domain-containing protein [Microbulbifer okhotskensis]